MFKFSVGKIYYKKLFSMIVYVFMVCLRMLSVPQTI
jgi:hypothetical protein